MELNKEFFVFISYSSLDNEWAIWLRHELEHYHLPASFNGRTDVRDNLRKVFRDRDELSAGPEWDEQVQKALEDTNNLIVICSPHSAESPAVNKEIETFIALGKEEHIFPFIVEGDKPEDCFPKALKHSKLGGDVNKDGGRDPAFIKVVAGMLKVSFPSLWNRYEIEKAEEERKQREQRDNLLRVQSRYIAEKTKELSNEGYIDLAKRLLLEVLPKNLEYPNRPYTLEAESALRFACEHHSAKLIILTDGVKFASISPDGKHIVSASGNNTYQVWDTETGQKIMQLEISKGSFTTILYNNDGEISNLTYSDNSQQIWDDQTEEIFRELIKRDYCANSVYYSKEGHFIVSASNDNVIVIWDARSGKEIMKYEKILNTSYETLLDGRFVASLDWNHASQLLDAEILKEIKMSTEFIPGISSLVFSDDVKHLILSSKDNTIRLWDIRSMKKYSKIESVDHVSAISFSPDGKYIVAASNEIIIIWSTETRKEFLRLVGHKRSVNSVAFSPDGKRIVSSALYDTVIVWDAKTGTEQLKIKERTYKVNSVAFSPDGNWIVSGTGEEDADDIFKLSYDYSVLIWNAKTGELYKELRGHSYVAHSAVFSPNGKIVVSASSDKTVRVWDVETACGLKVLKGHGNTVCSVIVSLDGTKIISRSDDNTIRVWDVETGKELLIINLSHRNHSIDLSHDGKWIISTAGGVQIWDIETGYIIWEIKNNSVYATISPDGKFLAFIDRDGTIIMWRLSGLQDLINANRACYKNYPLSSIERKRYYLE